jgi:2-(3-amino-3-carboxypropyl)histidine synthase
MKLLTIDASYNGEIKLTEELFSYLESKNYKNVALFASVQFVKHLDSVKKQLKNRVPEIKIITSRGSRTHVEGQILGCDLYEENLHLKDVEGNEEIDCYLYIGDGLFHPKALLFSQKERSKEEFREIIMFDPIANKTNKLNYEDNERVMKRLKGNLMKLLASDTLGFIATIKPGQSFLYLKDKLVKKYPKKKVYVFLTDNINENTLEPYTHIDVWINSACPRLGFDDAEHMQFSMVNIVDALRAEEIVSKL